ncbi:MAG: hypothetical protein JXQ73_24810 [Phycisphaerae bacterium]|nr:hypothetical protein [Phycisphaerae bacterium]
MRILDAIGGVDPESLTAEARRFTPHLVGSPHETAQSLRTPLAFAGELPLDFAHFNRFVPYPGTEFDRELAEQGYRFNFSKTSDFELDNENVIFVPPAIDPAEYRRLLDGAYRGFYLRPRYVLRRLLAIRTLTELLGQLGGLRVLVSG